MTTTQHHIKVAMKQFSEHEILAFRKDIAFAWAVCPTSFLNTLIQDITDWKPKANVFVSPELPRIFPPKQPT
jgi:hypothetical protein